MQNAELQGILNRFIRDHTVESRISTTSHSRPELDLSRVVHPDDKVYCRRLEQAMRELDAGNPNTTMNMVVLEGLYVFVMVYFRNRIGEDEYPQLRRLVHPQPGWNPIHSMFCQDTDLGTGFFVKVNPLPQIQALPAPPQRLMLVQQPPPPVSQPQQQLALIPVQEPQDNSRHGPRRSATSRHKKEEKVLVKPRKGLVAGVVRLFVNPPKTKKKSHRSRSASPNRNGGSSDSSE